MLFYFFEGKNWERWCLFLFYLRGVQPCMHHGPRYHYSSEKLKYTHLYKLDTTFQNIYMSYEPPPPPTSRQLSHLTLLKGICYPGILRSFNGCGSIRHCWFSKQMNPPYESELGFGPEGNVCVGLGYTFLKTTQVSSLTSNSLCCPPSLSWHVSMEIRSQVQQQQGEWTRQKPGQPAKYPPPKTERQSRPLLSLKAAVKID